MASRVVEYVSSGLRARLVINEGYIEAVDRLSDGAVKGESFATAPFVDIQMNGRWGVSFSDPALTVEQVIEVMKAQAHLGTGAVCPTLITASPEATRHGIQTIIEATRRDSLVNRLFAGIHLEGPWISEKEGFRGAHPLREVRDPNLREFDTWYEDAEGRISIVTLAPEREGACEAIRQLTSLGIVVAVGHSAADVECLKRATEAGATLATHVGNGVASSLPRHPNPIWDQLSNARLKASFIADGHHVDLGTLRTMIKAKGNENSILVSDFSPLAGLPTGVYGPWEVHPSGKIIVAGTPYLAGANRGLCDAISLLYDEERRVSGEEKARESLPAIVDMATTNPRLMLGMGSTELRSGMHADLVIWNWHEGRICPEGTYLGGQWFSPEAPASPWSWS